MKQFLFSPLLWATLFGVSFGSFLTLWVEPPPHLWVEGGLAIISLVILYRVLPKKGNTDE